MTTHPLFSLILPANEDQSFIKKADVIFQIITNLSKRHSYSSFFSELNQRALRFLIDIPRNFFKNHSAYHLCRMIGTFAFFEKELNQRAEITPKNRHLLVRILKNLTTDEKENTGVLGFLAVLKLSGEEDFFHTSYFLKAIQSVVPGVEEIPDSLFIQRDQKNCLVFLYLEVRKIRGHDFSYKNIKYIREALQEELREWISCFSPSLIIQPNDEEIYRDIIHLSRELKFLQDIPQVMISFQEQSGNLLKFTVIILRVLREPLSSWYNSSTKLPPSLRIVSEQVSKVGLIEKKYPKEATLLTVEVENALFFRKNHSVDLRKARQYLVKAIELMVGEFRDYNGGFLSKQDEQLECIKNSLDEKTKKHALLLEKLFYSLVPTVFQAFLLPETCKAWTLLFNDALQQEPTPMQKYQLFTKEHPLFALALVKTRHSEFKMIALEEILKACLNSSQVGYSNQEIEGFFYFSFIFQSPITSQLKNLLDQILSHFALDSLVSVSREKKQILRINFQEGDPPSLNPHIGIDMRCYTLGKALFEGLTRLDPKGIPELAAAENLTVSPCGTQYTFQLRPMKWSNGEIVTAFHFENAWKKAISPFSHCLRPDLFYLIKNARKAHLNQIGLDAIGISSLGSKTLHIELEYPSPYFIELLADPLFSPLYEPNKEPTVFNGPFVMRAWKRDQQIILDRNPFYWDADKIRLNRIEISMQKDPDVVLKKFEEGEIDWIGNPFSLLPLEKARDLKKRGFLKIKSILGIYCLHCNTNYLPLSSTKVRRALSYAINRQQLCADVLLAQTPCYSPIPPELSLVKESGTFPEGNIQIAQMLLEEGLREIGFSSHALPSFTLLHAHIGGQKQLAQAIQNQWKKAFGIQVQTAELEWNTLSSLFDRRQFQIGGCYRNFLYNDPMYFFNLLNDSANYLNASAWQHPSFQEILDLANHSTDSEVRNHYLRQAEGILIDEMPIIPLHVDTFYYTTKDTLQGFHLSNLGNVDFKNAYFKEITNK